MQRYVIFTTSYLTYPIVCIVFVSLGYLYQSMMNRLCIYCKFSSRCSQSLPLYMNSIPILLCYSEKNLKNICVSFTNTDVMIDRYSDQYHHVLYLCDSNQYLCDRSYDEYSIFTFIVYSFIYLVRTSNFYLSIT